jgi:hypothetical protein
LAGVIRLQQSGDRRNILHSGVKPEIVAFWIEDHGHPVVIAEVTAFEVVVSIEQVSAVWSSPLVTDQQYPFEWQYQTIARI